MSERTRYAVVGLGARSRMYTEALLGTYRDRAELTGLCDINPSRMAFQVKRLAETYDMSGVRCFAPNEFSRMLTEQHIDVVIVTSIDRTHDQYIVTALEHGCEVVTEKPLTTDEAKCQSILDAQTRTQRGLTVTFNYRYSPRNSTVKELLQAGAIGDVLSVHFEWLLDTRHGADYFRRWHRDKRNSGGLMIHKASHHFDLVNWWLAATPSTVFGLGGLSFYGRDNAEARGEAPRRYRSHGSPDLARDPWGIDLAGDPRLDGLYLQAESDDGYVRDRDVFSDGISIEDDMSVLVRYSTGATMTYHLTAYSPWEGYRVMFNGTKGRLELDVEERSYVSGRRDDPHSPGVDPSTGPPLHTTRLTLRPLWEPPQEIAIEEGGSKEGGHGGGDRRLLDDLFGSAPLDDPLGRAAGHVDGAYAMLVGAAANRSFATGLPVHIGELVRLPE